MIDFDALLLTPAQAAFGQPVMYRPLSGEPCFGITGIYDQAFREIVISGEGPEIASSGPALGVQLSQFAAIGRPIPVKGDQLVVERLARVFNVREVRADGQGAALLLLNIAADTDP